MAVKKITMLGSQAVPSTKKNVLEQVIVRQDAVSVGADNDEAISKFSIVCGFSGGDPDGLSAVRLYNSAGALVETARASIQNGVAALVIKADDAVDVSAMVGSSSDDLIHWNVALDAFATGRVELDLNGALSTISILVRAPLTTDPNTQIVYFPTAYESNISGAGKFTVSIPFAVSLV